MSLITSAQLALAETLPSVGMGGRKGSIFTRRDMLIKLMTLRRAFATVQ